MAIALKKRKPESTGINEEQLAQRLESVPSGHSHTEEEHNPFASHGHKKEEGEGPWLVSYADMMTLLMGFFALIASFSKPDQKEFEKVKKAATEQFGGKYEQPYKDLETNLKKFAKENNLEKFVKIENTPDGVKLTFAGSYLFDSGDFNVKPDAKPILDKMVSSIDKEAKGHNIIIEGHTDNRPISHAIIASNWELSGIRAARIAQFFEIHNFKKKQLTILGLGETQPEAPNEDKNGTPLLENQSKNRRVVIKIYKPL